MIVCAAQHMLPTTLWCEVAVATRRVEQAKTMHHDQVRFSESISCGNRIQVFYRSKRRLIAQ